MARTKREKNQTSLNSTAIPAVKSARKADFKVVKTTRDELSVLLPQYFQIRDCIDGEPAIKGQIGLRTFSTSGDGGAYNGGGYDPTQIIVSRARRYLPMPNAHDQSTENVERYKSYVQRAVFYNVVSRTLEGMVGQVFLIDPVHKMPKLLEDIILEDADGQGLSMIQLSKRAVRYTGAHGRAGLLVDYPPTVAPTTQAQLNEGDIRPIITVFPPWNIINWRTKKRGVKTILSLIVLRETLNDIGDDGFTVSPTEQYKALKLVEQDNGNDVYTIETYSFDPSDKSDKGEPGDVFVPKDSNGKTFDTIPFTFIGSENNDDAVDKPPLYDLSSLNIAHYRNSADYEEACFICGQPTPVAIGITEQWYIDVLKSQLSLGSRGGIPLPPGASIELIQAKENGMPLEAMHLKEDQMVAIGAKLVTQRKRVRTATETISDTSSEQSVLTNVANNVSAAMEFALQFAARFIGATGEIKYTLNTAFELNRMTFDDVIKLVTAWQKGAITFNEMRQGIRKAGLATLSDDEAMAQISKEVAMGLATGPVADPFGQLEAAANAAPNPNNDPGGHATKPATRGQ